MMTDLGYQQSVGLFKRYHSESVTNISHSFTYNMAAKINWHRYGRKLRHCHSMYTRHVTNAESDDVISMPAGFRRRLHIDIVINQRIEYYLNNTITLRPLTPHIMPCYTHKMAIVSWPYIL